MSNYLDRHAAGKILADHLLKYVRQKDLIVLALPRGGVPVAFEVAKVLNCPLDLFIVRKLGVPGHSELAMGAIAMGNVKYLNQEIIQYLGISSEQIAEVVEAEQQELKRRELAYRDNKPPVNVTNKTVILIDDGIATGATIKAAIMALHQLKPKKIVVAVPVGQKDLITELSLQVDEVICPLQPEQLYAVGQWYQNFLQTEDEEVYSLLAQETSE